MRLAFDFMAPSMGWSQPASVEDADDESTGQRYRAIFISDLHLGTTGCQADALLDFMKAHPSDFLYLVGDIVDGWQLRRRWYWPQSHNDVVQKLLRRARKGCRVIFVPGNHDEFARGFIGHQFGGVEVVEDAVHRTADGRDLWITHGDYFDGVIQCAKWLAYLGDNLYEFTLKLNRHLNYIRARLGLPYWSLSAYLKHKVKKALNYVTQFEVAVAHEAKRRGHQGVVCGHIHRAEMRDINGTLYCNDGDWVESRTALVEHYDGTLELLHWPALQGKGAAAVPMAVAVIQTSVAVIQTSAAVIPQSVAVIMDSVAVIPDSGAVIPDSIRDPVPRAHWIAGQARNDKEGSRNDKGGSRNDKEGSRNDKEGSRNDKEGSRNDKVGHAVTKKRPAMTMPSQL